MSIRDYYLSEFRRDIETVTRGMTYPEACVMLGLNWMHECSLLPRVTESRRPFFLVCLYFTVLVDQAMHSHFGQWHHEFERLTLYPKFRVGLGHPAHLNPIFVFTVPIERKLVLESDIRALIPDGMSLFVDETDDFFRHHMPQITASQFFERLLADPDVASFYRGEAQADVAAVPLQQFVAHHLRKAVSDGLTSAA
jgi:hypothetical protein